MRQRSISEIAKPVCKLWKFSGLPVYELENGKFVNKNSKGFVFPLVFIAVNMVFYLKSKIFSNDVNSYVNLIQFVSIYMLDVGLIFYSYISRKRIESIFSNFLLVEKMLQRFSGNELPGGKVGRNLLIYLSCQVILTIIQVVALTTFSDPPDLNYVTENICYHSLVIYSYNFNIVLFFYLLTLNELHSNFNVAIKNNMAKKMKVLENDFRRIVEIYTVLHKLSTDVHRTFEKLILLKILKDFIIAVSTAFYATFTMMEYTTVLSYLSLILQTAMFLMAILMSNFGMAYFFEEISKQVSFVKSDEQTVFLIVVGRCNDGPS
jgi:hypothetical protein